jgi:hypothetical protein
MWGGPAGPDEGPEGPPLTEDTMGYVMFLVIAFVLLGIERFVTQWHTNSSRHRASPLR